MLKSLYSFKNKLIVLLSIVVLLVTLFMVMTQNYFVSMNYEAMDTQRHALVEDNIIKLMRATDSVYQVLEKSIEKESEALLQRMVERYRIDGLSGIDLGSFYDAQSELDLYVIDNTDTVIAATYTADIGLNLSQFEGVGEFLDGIRSGGVFFSDRLSLSSLENRVMKYCYLPTPDGKYIFETGRQIDKDQDIPDLLRFGDFGDIISKNQGFVLSALLFSRYGVSFNEDVSAVRYIDSAYQQYYDEALDTLQPVSFSGTYKGQAARIKYLPFIFEDAGELHEQTVIELIYSNADLQQSKDQMLLLMLLTGLIGSVLIAVFAIRMSNKLVSPLKTLHDGIRKVSQGDYDSRIELKEKDEFSYIAGQFNEMTARIKAAMTDQLHKEQEIKDLYKKESSLNDELFQLIQNNKQSYFETIKALANAEEEKDAYTRGHCERVMNYALSIGKSLHLSDSDMDALKSGAILHDIGKIGIPEQILNKEGPLTNEEFALIKQHPSVGTRILSGLTFMKDSIRIIHEHHEWYDGHGYPSLIKEGDIDLLARIVCVADAFDAMTSQRPYRKVPMTVAQAVAELRKKSGIQFDPQIVEIFVASLDQANEGSSLPHDSPG